MSVSNPENERFRGDGVIPRELTTSYACGNRLHLEVKVGGEKS